MVDYIFIGPQKTGTTFLYEYFKTNPHCNISEKIKEINYFSEYFYRGDDWYEKHFDTDKGPTIDFEPRIFGNTKAVLNLKKYNKIKKIFVILRDPYKRLFSLYNHWCRYGLFDKNIEYYVSRNSKNILKTSLYNQCINEIYNNINSDKIHIIYYEELFRNVEYSLKRLCDIMNIKYVYNDIIFEKVNASSYARNKNLAKFVTYFTRKLKKHEMYLVINVLKKIGFRKIIYGKDGSSNNEISNNDIKIMHEYLSKDIEDLKRRCMYHKMWINNE